MGETKYMYVSLTEGPRENRLNEFDLSRTKMIAIPLFEGAVPDYLPRHERVGKITSLTYPDTVISTSNPNSKSNPTHTQ